MISQHPTTFYLNNGLYTARTGSIAKEDIKIAVFRNNSTVLDDFIFEVNCESLKSFELTEDERKLFSSTTDFSFQGIIINHLYSDIGGDYREHIYDKVNTLIFDKSFLDKQKFLFQQGNCEYLSPEYEYLDQIVYKELLSLFAQDRSYNKIIDLCLDDLHQKIDYFCKKIRKDSSSADLQKNFEEGIQPLYKQLQCELCVTTPCVFSITNFFTLMEKHPKELLPLFKDGSIDLEFTINKSTYSTNQYWDMKGKKSLLLTEFMNLEPFTDPAEINTYIYNIKKFVKNYGFLTPSDTMSYMEFKDIHMFFHFIDRLIGIVPTQKLFTNISGIQLFETLINFIVCPMSYFDHVFSKTTIAHNLGTMHTRFADTVRTPQSAYGEFSFSIIPFRRFDTSNPDCKNATDTAKPLTPSRLVNLCRFMLKLLIDCKDQLDIINQDSSKKSVKKIAKLLEDKETKDDGKINSDKEPTNDNNENLKEEKEREFIIASDYIYYSEFNNNAKFNENDKVCKDSDKYHSFIIDNKQYEIKKLLPDYETGSYVDISSHGNILDNDKKHIIQRLQILDKFLTFTLNNFESIHTSKDKAFDSFIYEKESDNTTSDFRLKPDERALQVDLDLEISLNDKKILKDFAAFLVCDIINALTQIYHVKIAIQTNRYGEYVISHKADLDTLGGIIYALANTLTSKRLLRKCEFCQKLFYPHIKHPNSACCSHACSAALYKKKQKQKR